MQLDIYRIERETGVSKKYTFPMYVVCRSYYYLSITSVPTLEHLHRYEQMISHMLTQFVASVKKQKKRVQCIKDLGSVSSALRVLPSSKKKKRKKRKHKTISAWQIFVKERMQTLNNGVNATKLMKQISCEWKQLTQRRKTYYFEKCEKLRKEYDKTKVTIHDDEKEQKEEEEKIEMEIPDFDENDLLKCLELVETFSEDARESLGSVKSRTKLWRARRDFNIIYDAMRKRKKCAIDTGDKAAAKFLNVAKRLSETYGVICDVSYAEIEREHASKMIWQAESAALVSKDAIREIKNAVGWLLKHKSVYPLVSSEAIQNFRDVIAE